MKSNIFTRLNISMSSKQLEVEQKRHRLWSGNGGGGKLKYLYSNKWDKSVDDETKQGTRRFEITGVEVRDLPEGHVLHGEQGLFATKKFERFDVIAEYTGQIVPSDVGGKNLNFCQSIFNFY